MTTQVSFTLKGLEAWFEELAHAERDVDQAAQEVLEDGATEVQAKMQKLVPIDTRNLHDHIQLDGPHQEGNFSYVDVGVIHDIDFTNKDTAIYGNVIEYGGVRRVAQPYIRPAIRSSKYIMKKAMKQLLARYGL